MSKITKSARGQMCVRCFTNDGTICARHYNGMRQHTLGKGRGIKCHDLASAELCARCDAIFTEGNNSDFEGKSIFGIEVEPMTARSEEFLLYCLLTTIARYERGDLKV